MTCSVTFEIGLLFFILAVMVVLFMTEKLPVDLTAFCGLVLMTLLGYVSPSEAFTGFSSPAVITMLAIFILSAALLQTGVADAVGGRLHAAVGSREVPLIVTIMVLGGVMSAFMNNIAATAVLMPAVAGISRRTGLSPSRLFMPLAFGAILGGTTTMVGTPPNILTGDILMERGLEPFGLFDFTPMGLVLLAVGVLFMATLGRRLLPSREVGPIGGGDQDLTQVYQLRERFFSIRIPQDSPLDGISLSESHLRSALGIQVAAIVRDGKEELAPSPDSVLRSGDTLLVEGSRSDLEELLRMQSLQIEKADTRRLPPLSHGISGLSALVEQGSTLEGLTLQQLKFRERFGAVIVGIRRDDRLLSEQLGQTLLRVGDELLALGPRDRLAEMAESPEFGQVRLGLSTLQQLRERLFFLRIPPDSPLVGETLGSSRLGELAGITIAGIIRGGETRLAASSEETVLAEDRLLIACEPGRIVKMKGLGQVELGREVRKLQLESDEIAVVEAALAPRSSLFGSTLTELEFRDRYGLQVLAIWREGEPLHEKLAQTPLKFGDALLVQGPHSRILRLASDPDFVVLSSLAVTLRRTEKAPYALGALGLMIFFVVFGLQPIHVAAFTAATAAVLAGAISMEESYRAIEWRALFLVAAILPVGIAMEQTGAALLMATAVSDLAGPYGIYALLAAFVVLSSALSQALDGAPAVVLVAPVALNVADGLGVSPYPVMMAVSLAASAAFMTPFSHKANLLVMGAGNYQSMDYMKVGAPLTVVLLILLVLMTPLFFPF